MRRTSWRWLGIWLALLVLATLPALNCGGDGATTPDGDTEEDGDAPLTCVGPGDCPEGMVCTPQGVCTETADGDVPDGDLEPTRLVRSVPEGTVNFGNVEIVSRPEATVTLYNDGNQPVNLFDVNWLAPVSDNPFSLASYDQTTIQPGQNYAFRIGFLPKDLGETAGRIRINNDSSNAPQLELDVVANVVLQAGTATIGSSPEEVVFEDHPLGRLAAQATVRIGNSGDGSSELRLTSVYLASQEDGPYTVSGEQDPTETNPLLVGAGRSESFRIMFAPVQVGEFKDILTVEYHTNADSTKQLFEVPVTGRAINGVIALMPSLVDFETVTLGTSRKIDLRIVNNNMDETVRVNSVQVRMKDGSNWRDFYEFTDAPAQLSLPPAQRHDFSLTFSPPREGNYAADLVISTDYQGQTLYFSIIASGSAANQKPIARIAQRANGPDIVQPIEVPLNTPLEFFGDISYDPDGDSSALTYEWFLQKPAGSTANLTPNAVSPVVNALFDAGGTYMLTLVVTDEQGAQSSPKSITVKTTAGLSIVTVEMVAGGITGESDVDLTWILPIGTSCNETNVAQSGYCMAPEGYGSIRFEGCSQASVCTIERATHANPPDGRYQIRIMFDEDCSKSWPENCLIWGKQSAEVDILIYVDGQMLYRIDNTRLAKKGDQVTWNFVRSGGVWQNPTRVVR